MAAVRDPLVSFVWGKGGAALTPEEIAQQRELESAVRAKGIDTSPVGHWTQGAARVADAIAGAYQRGSLDKASNENATYNEGIISSLLKGSTPTATTSGATSSIPASGASAEMAATSPAPVDLSGDQQSFVAGLLPAAIEESKRTGVDPRIIVAQAAQETGWGKSAPGNNYFGIKSHGKDGGQTLATNEVIDGKTVRINDSFRQFASPADSVRGYGDFLLENPRYEKMRTAQGLDAQLEALGASGYATDPNYSSSVGAIARGIQLPSLPLPVDRGATLADPSQVNPEDAARLAVIRGVQGGNAKSNGPGALIDQPMAVYDTEGLRMEQPQSAAGAIQQQAPLPVGESLSDEAASFRQTPEYAAQFPGQDLAAQQPAQQPAQSQAVQQVAQALPAAGQGQQADPMMNEALIRAISDPRATAQTKAIAQALMQQQMAQQEAQREQQTWMQRQQYEQQQQQNDPLRRQQFEMGQIELDRAKNPEAKPPSLVDIYDQQTGQPYKAQWNQETKQFDRVGGIKAPSGTSLTVSPDGQVSFSTGGAKPLTENQSKLTLFQSLQTETQPVLLDLESQFNPANIADAAARSTPIAGNFFQSEQGQIYSAASTAWAEGALRIATGAAATPEEMERTKRAYFAQPGDTPNAIAFKAQMREMYNRSIDRSLGKKDVKGTLPKPSDFAKKFDDEDEVPEGVDAADWEFMSPEDRSLFKQ